jgi:ADP-ribose pyrophosphatase YjhB (NUDIX family)
MACSGQSEIMRFEDSYIGQLRPLVGSRTLIVPGFRALIFDKTDAFLVMRRADTGLWGLPSGSMELGESAAHMIEREVQEETGLHIASSIIYGIASEPGSETHVYPNGHRIQNFSILAAVHDWVGTPVAIDGEAVDLRFVGDIEEIPTDSRVEQEMRCVAAYQQYIQTGMFQLL